MNFVNYMVGKPGASGFGSKSTCYDVASTFSSDIKDKVVFITGCSSGIGIHTATAVAKHGATVIMACRNKVKMHTVAEKIRKEAPNSVIHEIVCDVGSMASVRKSVEEFNALNLPLDVLINNAGVMACPFSLTEDGYELQFGTNHLGHFLLTNLLIPKLKEGVPSRVVNVASVAHRFAPPEGILWDYLKTDEKYSRWTYYGQSKLCNMLHAHELNCRLQEQGITAVSLHPGVINTNLGRHIMLYKVVSFATSFFLKSEPQGAATSIFCAFAKIGQPGFEPGGFHDSCNVGRVEHKAYNADTSKKLWEFSAKVTNSDL
jgi:NAD(P)-dependent dehydrogenase (short-subunit alcohol dehydrogenase family)